METQEPKNMEGWEQCGPRHSRKGRILGGLIIVAAGSALLARKMGVLIPDWVFTWETAMVVLGLYIGAKHSFRGIGWLILIGIGTVFIIDRNMPDVSIRPYLWPVLIILAGLMMIFRPRRKWDHNRWQRWEQHRRKWEQQAPVSDPSYSSTEDRIDTVSVFGGVKKNIISKDFRGGEITCVFGGAEINLAQADINGQVVLEVNQFFGGAKLIVPPHWKIQSEMVAVFGGIEDKRSGNSVDHTKVLIIKGTSVFGGLEIRSY